MTDLVRSEFGANRNLHGDIDFDRMNCPLPLNDYEQVLLGHGSGGSRRPS